MNDFFEGNASNLTHKFFKKNLTRKFNKIFLLKISKQNSPLIFPLKVSAQKEKSFKVIKQ